MQKRVSTATLLAFTIFSTSSFATAGSDELNQGLKRIFSSQDFDARRFGPARWIRAGTSFTTIEPAASIPGSQEIIEYDTASGKRSIMVSASQLKPVGVDKPLNIEDYTWDRDFRRLLVFTQSRRTWRTNTRGDYWLLDRATGVLKKLGGDAPESSLMFAKFSPDGSSVAYARGGNLFVEDLSSNKVRALTSDGSETLVNGSSDWVYEEELNLRDGFRWSPDGQDIAFWQFDESGVQQFTILDNTNSLYPKLTKFPYPKAGTKNSSVRVGTVSVSGGLPRWIQIPGDPRENYIFRMDWLDDHRLVIGQLNRKQNTATVYLGDANSGTARVIFRDQDDAWVDLPEGDGAARKGESFDWLDGHKSFIWLSERDGWRRGYAISMDGANPSPLTPSATDVISMNAVDSDGRWIYYTASPENATQRFLYRSPVGRSLPPERLTPSTEPGTHQYRISPDGRWAFHYYSTFDKPPVIDLVSLPDHKRVRMLEANEQLRTNASALLDPPVEFLQVPLADGVTLDGWMLKPHNFDPTKKYPVLVYVYGEPAATTVVDEWQWSLGLFHRTLSAEGYLVVSFDNRGTPAPKGRAWRKAVYGSVGVLSTLEQTEAVFALAKARPFVDLSRVGVWGWSGGGTNTLNLIFRSPDLFRVGVAVAPVPDQKLYDTIYQERYMGIPDENPDGYRSGSAINFAGGLRGNLLIIHGSGDDNVHFQGTERLINKLVELGKPFDFMEYPNRSHGIYEGEGTSLHLYSLIARYIEQHLPPGAR